MIAVRHDPGYTFAMSHNGQPHHRFHRRHEHRSVPHRYSREIKQSLDACYKEGIASALMMTILDYYLVPFFLFLKATTPQIGFLTAVPPLLSSFSQFFAVQAVRLAKTRRRL